MLSVRDIQEKTIGYFAGKGVPNPKLDTDLLIAHALGVKRLELYLDLDRPLTGEELDALRPLVKRRAEREPLQYILGQTEFYGLTLRVDRRALIPRPETEELIEIIRSRLSEAPGRIIDLGTGSGAIAIALALAYPEAEIWATDQSGEALELAEENAQRQGLQNRIHFKKGSWWAALPGDDRFDLIVSNPPYLTEAEMETAEPEVVANEPRAALVAGQDGLDDLKDIIAGIGSHLAPGGIAALETGIAQHPELERLSGDAGLQGEGVSDMSGRPRFFFAGALPVEAQDSNPPVDASPTTAPAANSNSTDTQQNETVKQPAKASTPGSGGSYFVTCYTEDGKTGLDREPCALSIINILQELHAETSIDLLAATVMPDHFHILLTLGRRLSLPQVVAKFKAASRNELLENGLHWQSNDFAHRLTSDPAREKLIRYLFLHPYQEGVISEEETWPWWILNENYRPECFSSLDDPPLPPKEWLQDAPSLEVLLGEDI